MTERIEVVVAGGGYAGVMAANHLRQRDDVEVTLVNPRPSFVERIRLHQVAARTGDAAVDFRDVLGEGIGRVEDTVTRIDAAGRRVSLASGGDLPYDYLVYAVGSGSRTAGVPGAAELAYPVASLEEATRLRSVLDDAPAEAVVTVVGAGPTGIEVAAELAGGERTVRLVCGGVLGPYLHPRTRPMVARHLEALGVHVLDGPGTAVVAVEPGAVRLADGRELPSDITVWAAGFSVPELARRSGLRTDRDGRLLTDETLTSVDDDRIVAAGDVASPSGLPFRMSCQAAVPLGAQAANTILSRIAGTEPAPVSLALLGECISLGRHDAVIQRAHRDDTATAFHVGGRGVALVKETACRLAVASLTREARRPGSVFWIKDRGRAARVRERIWSDAVRARETA